MTPILVFLFTFVCLAFIISGLYVVWLLRRVEEGTGCTFAHNEAWIIRYLFDPEYRYRTALGRFAFLLQAALRARLIPRTGPKRYSYRVVRETETYDVRLIKTLRIDGYRLIHRKKIGFKRHWLLFYVKETPCSAPATSPASENFHNPLSQSGSAPIRPVGSPG